MNKREVIVVGGGLAGLSTTMRLVEQGIKVKLISFTRVKRSHSVCAQGGINAAMNTKDEGDSPLIHAYETIKGGDFLGNQPPIVEMCLSAPGIIHMMEHLGCPFNRTEEGNVDVRRFGGSLFHRTVFCGASTGQQLLYTLDEQVRRGEVKGLVQKFENHDFLRLILDNEGRVRGCVVMDTFNMKIEHFFSDAVVIATGGNGMIFRKSTNSVFCTGAPNGRIYMQGAKYANGEFIQVHPTAIPGEDKLRLMSESTRGEGGRIWIPGDSSKKIVNPQGIEIPCGRTGEPWYFLEELYPAYGNLVPRDIASREVLKICELGLGIEGRSEVYLDVSHLTKEKLKKLEAVIEIYEKFTGEDPSKIPMRIFPAVHYTMGGCYVDWPAYEDPDRMKRFRQMSNIPGCFNVGESDYEYHGANRLGANSLLSCIFAGLIAAHEIPRYLDTVTATSENLSRLADGAVAIEEARKKEILERKGPENIHLLYDELSDVMLKYLTVVRKNSEIEFAINKIKHIKERTKKISLDDKSRFANQTFIFANQFDAMLEISLVIARCAQLRDESRGSHFKSEFPKRDDALWLKTTIAEKQAGSDEPKISYIPVDTRYIKPTFRDYTKKESLHPHFEGLPANIPLPV